MNVADNKDQQGFPVKSNLDNTTTSQYGKLVVGLFLNEDQNVTKFDDTFEVGLAERAKSIVRDLDPTNHLTFFRMKSESHEVVADIAHYYLLKNGPECAVTSSSSSIKHCHRHNGPRVLTL